MTQYSTQNSRNKFQQYIRGVCNEFLIYSAVNGLVSTADSIYELETFATMVRDSVANESFAVLVDANEFTANSNSFQADSNTVCEPGEQQMNSMFCGSTS